jgi:hypothetical protein
VGVTALKRLVNWSGQTLQLRNIENPGTRGHDVPVGPDEEIEIDMWVPWAPEADDFPAHHLEVVLDGTPRAAIWQAAREDGDYVRASRHRTWEPLRCLVQGNAEVDGERIISIASGGEVHLQRLQPVHGVTTLVSLQNHSGHRNQVVTVFNAENSGTLGHGVPVSPSARTALNMWVPWATSQEEFEHHHLRVEVAADSAANETGMTYWIWQAERSDGDWVRYSTDGLWHDPGRIAVGLAEVGGERTLRVHGTFGFELGRT